MLHLKHKTFDVWIITMLVFLALLLSNLPTTPQTGEEIDDPHVSFNWIGYASYAIVDDNPSFSSPLRIRKGNLIKLQPGTYYWKVSGLGRTQTFTVPSILALDVQKQDKTKTLSNTGTTDAKIKTKQKNKLTGEFILEPGQQQKLAQDQEDITGEVHA